jgi:hypothetical protein
MLHLIREDLPPLPLYAIVTKGEMKTAERSVSNLGHDRYVFASFSKSLQANSTIVFSDKHESLPATRHHDYLASVFANLLLESNNTVYTRTYHQNSAVLLLM